MVLLDEVSVKVLRCAAAEPDASNQASAAKATHARRGQRRRQPTLGEGSAGRTAMAPAVRRCYGWHGRGGAAPKPRPAPVDEDRTPALDARALCHARRAVPIRHWLSHESWRHAKCVERRRRHRQRSPERPVTKAPAKRRRRKPAVVIAPPADEDRRWPDEASPRWAKRRGAAKNAGLNSKNWRRETGTLTRAAFAVEAAIAAEKPHHTVDASAMQGHFVLRWYLVRFKRYAALCRWRARKHREATVRAARDAEARPFDGGREARAARAQRRWRELSWRHVNRVGGLGGDAPARRLRTAERRYATRRWGRLELGWDGGF